MDQEIANMDAGFRLDVVRKNKEFDERRAQIFATVHGQVTEQVKRYCDYFGTLVVLKIAREKPDPKKPATIETAMMQEVFYHNTGIDITDWVIQELKTAAGVTATGPAQAAGIKNPNAPVKK
jgi:hypothetical protein